MAQDFALCLLPLMLPMDVSVKLKELQRDAVTRGRKWLDNRLQSLNEQGLRSLASLLSILLARGDDVKKIVERLSQKIWVEESMRVADYSFSASVQRLCEDASDKGVSWLKEVLTDEAEVFTRWRARNNLQWLQHAVQTLTRQNLAAVCKAFGVDQKKDKRKAPVDELCAAFVQHVDSQARGLLKTHRSAQNVAVADTKRVRKVLAEELLRYDTKKSKDFGAKLQDLRQVVSDMGQAGLLQVLETMKQNVLRGVGNVAKIPIRDGKNEDDGIDLSQLGEIFAQGDEGQLERAVAEVKGQTFSRGPEPGHWYLAEERTEARHTILQLDYACEQDEVLLTFCNLAGDEKLRLTARSKDTVWDICKRVACKLNVSIQNLQILLPDNELLISFCRANPTATFSPQLTNMCKRRRRS
eukprot:s2211_g6.t1